MELENKYEKLAWKKSNLVMGIDEAGRGPLCGPLVVAACVFPCDYKNDQINDSKKLSSKKRDFLYTQIVEDALWFSIKIVEPDEIDRLNILEATRTAMEELSNSYEVKDVLTDAVKISNSKNIPIIKGDAKSISIAAASILAKVTRDRIMLKLHEKYPIYEFNNHKGYPTKKHLELINKYGVIKGLYRFSYKPVKGKRIK